MLRDLDHPFSEGEPVYDVTFENVQAGLRTDYLFRLANHNGGIVLGTGDLSELALGWCTYGVGDQMSHYAVNTGVPKTFIQHLIRWVIGEGLFDDDVNAILQAILEQKITPELVPSSGDELEQDTEESIGPYALQDFNLFHTLRNGYRPSKIAFLAEQAWHDKSEGEWPPGFPEERRTSTTSPRSGIGSRCSSSGSSPSPSSSAAPCPTAPRCPRADRSPRAATGGPRPTATPAAWLADIEQNIPDITARGGQETPTSHPCAIVGAWASRKTSCSGRSRSATSGS